MCCSRSRRVSSRVTASRDSDGDLVQLGFGGTHQLLALATALLADERIAADDQPFSRIRRIGDFSQIASLAIELAERDALVVERLGDLLAQCRLARVLEARDQRVVDRDRLFQAIELAEPEALVEERLGELLAQRRLARTLEARDQRVVDRDRLFRAIELAERDALVEERLVRPARAVPARSRPRSARSARRRPRSPLPAYPRNTPSRRTRRIQLRVHQRRPARSPFLTIVRIPSRWVSITS